jgi:hypothetical protein
MQRLRTSSTTNNNQSQEMAGLMNHDIHMAKVYLAEARRTKHRNWAFVLLGWAAKRRLAVFKPAEAKGQLNLFGGA